jgi:hypothetical protein
MATRYKQMEHLIESFGGISTAVLHEVVDAMSDREFDDVFQHIISMWDLEDI